MQMRGRASITRTGPQHVARSRCCRVSGEEACPHCFLPRHPWLSAEARVDPLALYRGAVLREADGEDRGDEPIGQNGAGYQSLHGSIRFIADKASPAAWKGSAALWKQNHEKTQLHVARLVAENEELMDARAGARSLQGFHDELAALCDLWMVAQQDLSSRKSSL
eukprot:TRINITY_DN74025_c0_g1_i1.p1 TRINITY_DN74025_c0_g1~~TRINITY_DN74025_c0_g1_i1.p1  ORF type:complete len:165 (+),score=23.02 TRINITY_DN74025_c0_g1_i1:189-683(+)